MDSTAATISNLDAWKSEVDTQVFDLAASVAGLRKQVDRMVVGVGLSALGPVPGAAATSPTSPSYSAKGELLVTTSGPDGHRLQHEHRGQTKDLAPASAPVAGTLTDAQALAIVPVVESTHVISHGSAHATPQPPHTEFPRFDGENPRLWQKAAEKYFRLFAVDASYRVEYATMHFTGNAAMWLQSVEDRLPQFTWEFLCELLSKHFDRGQYQLLYR